ncbi:MAG: tRNA lysidine(34) synthetase TilS [Lachnospiraceae bacterium]|nr:tRNA lysidine(34) synthetase TilS [Lachnospiraceae bacterium]
MEISYQIRENVFRYITERRLIEQGDTVIAGVSGGADSVCLLFLLLELKPRLSFYLSVLHVEHGIRGEASRQDAAFVEALCQKHGIPFQLRSVRAADYAKEHKLTVEEAARILRYEAFADAIRNAGTEHVKIALAHHEEDQAETVLFQMARGSGLRGLGGMLPKRDNIIRPLLSCSRRDLLLYLEEKEEPYCTDETNADNSYARNRIRNKILPELTEIQPGCIGHMAKAAEELQEIEAFLRKQAEPLYQQVAKRKNNDLIIETDEFSKWDIVLQKEIIREAVGEFVPGKKDILRRHIDAILTLSDKENGKEIHLPKGIVVKKDGSGLLFRKSDEPEECEEGPWLLFTEEGRELDLSSETPIGNGRTVQCRIFPYDPNVAIAHDTYTKWLDYDRIKNGFQIRTRQKGDYLCIDETGHKKSLQDYFVNCKIPAKVRDKVLLIACGDHVIWIPGYRISTAYKITNETKNVIELQITGGFPWQTK